MIKETIFFSIFPEKFKIEGNKTIVPSEKILIFLFYKVFDYIIAAFQRPTKYLDDLDLRSRQLVLKNSLKHHSVQ